MNKKNKNGRPFQYETSFRRKVAMEYLSGEFSYSELAKRYQLKTTTNIQRWIKEYRKQQAELLSSNMENPQDKADRDSLEKAKKLEEELKLAKIKIAALETMIDIAEEQFKIEIRKKSGTKPSSE